MIDYRYLFSILAMTSILISCGSRVPYSTTFPFQSQRKMQAAKHWEVLAEDVAGQVKKCIAARKDLKVKPVYVVSRGETPFEEIFHDILISKLVSGGVLVSKKEKDTLRMDYGVKLLEHSRRDYSKFPLTFTALGAGIMVAREVSDWVLEDLLIFGTGAGLLADLGMSRYAGPPSHKEAVITTSLSYDDYYFMHQTDIYYINDPDAGHYVSSTASQTIDEVEVDTLPHMMDDLQEDLGNDFQEDMESEPRKVVDDDLQTEMENDFQEEPIVENTDDEAATEAINMNSSRRKFNVVD